MLNPAPPRLSPVRMEGSGREELDPGGDLKAVPDEAMGISVMEERLYVMLGGPGWEGLGTRGVFKAVPTGALREALGEVSGSGGGLSQTSCTMGGRVYLFFLGFLFTERRD